jgi:hypothetical protein
MKRPIALGLIIVAMAAVSACGDRPAPETRTVPAPDTWVTPPQIDAVTGTGSDLNVQGSAAPLGRVVVAQQGGQAYAVAADAEGRFELRMPRPRQDTLFVVEARAGQVAYPAPYRLLVAGDPAGPIALLSIGAPTLRLDPGPSLDSVDSDGRAAVLSGRAPPERVVALAVGPAPAQRVVSNGRWNLVVAGGAADSLDVDGVVYSPPVGVPAAAGVLVRAGAGWQIRWEGAGGARQSTWFPDRASRGALPAGR